MWNIIYVSHYKSTTNENSDLQTNTKAKINHLLKISKIFTINIDFTLKIQWYNISIYSRVNDRLQTSLLK